MKPRYFTSIIATAVFVVTTCAWAQKDSSPADIAVTDVDAGQIDLGAQDVAAANPAPSGSLAWYYHSAFVLVIRAHELRAKGDHDASQHTGADAIRMLTHGLTKSGTNARAADRSQIYVQIADIYDHILGDRASARQAYQQALVEQPDNGAATTALAAYDAEAQRLADYDKVGEQPSNPQQGGE
jgi:hypothetical protein